MKRLTVILPIVILLVINCNSSLTDDELNQKYLESAEKRDWESAIVSLDELIERHPENADAFFARAVAKSNLKNETDLLSMLKDLNTTIALDSTNHKAIFLRFQANMLDLNFESSLSDIEKFISLKGELPFLLSRKGNCAFASKKFGVAESAYEKRLGMVGEYDDMKNNYYYWIFSKYFGGNKNGAMWDCAFLPKRGFKEDTTLLRLIQEDKLVWEQLASFTIPEMTLEQLEKQVESKITAP